MGTDTTGNTEEINCISPCIYYQEGLPDSKFCFASGELAVECLGENEVASSPGLNENLFEGDMKLNADQIEMLKASLITGSLEGVAASDMTSEPSGNAVIATQYRWPSQKVKYQLAGFLSSSEKALVRETLKGLQAKLDSCLTFEESSSGNRIYVKNNGGGCYSLVGYQGSPTQELSL